MGSVANSSRTRVSSRHATSRTEPMPTIRSTSAARTRRTPATLVAGCLITLPLAVAATGGIELPVVEAVDGADSQWISRQMTVEGIPMSLLQFRTKRDHSSVAEHHRRDLAGRWPKVDVLEYERGEWTILAVRPDGYFISIKLRPLRNETVGYIAVSVDPEDAIGRTDNARATRLPLPRGMELRNRQTYLDAGRHAEQLVLGTTDSPATAARRLRDRLENDGWIAISQEQSSAGGGGDHWLYERRGELLRLQFQRAPHPGSGTLILALWMKQGG